MAMQDNNRVGWRYTADNARTYCVSAKAVYVLDATDGAKYGGQAASGTDPVKPRQMRMRAVRCTCAGHPDRWVPAYTSTATIWTTAGTTLVLNCNGADETYEATVDHRSEHYGHATRDAA